MGSVTRAPSRKEAVTWNDVIRPVEPFLRAVATRLAEQVEEFEPEVAAQARYALTNQGKQLRPALVALSAQAAGELNDDLVTAAAIIEMVHLATLVHDDVMDEARIRRRRPTLAARCGNTVSVLVGDCLFAHALKLAADFPTPDVCRAVAAATKIVCTGEILQTERAGQYQVSRDEYFRILGMKTGELFALSCELGAALGGAPDFACHTLRTYGMALGTAYQIYDDWLDLFGEETEVGKSLGTDLANGKVTLPLIVAVEKTHGADREELENLLRDRSPERLPRLVTLLEHLGAVEASAEAIHDFCRTAREAITRLPSTPGRRALERAAEFLAQLTPAFGV